MLHGKTKKVKTTALCAVLVFALLCAEGMPVFATQLEDEMTETEEVIEETTVEDSETENDGESETDSSDITQDGVVSDEAENDSSETDQGTAEDVADEEDADESDQEENADDKADLQGKRPFDRLRKWWRRARHGFAHPFKLPRPATDLILSENAEKEQADGSESTEETEEELAEDTETEDTETEDSALEDKPVERPAPEHPCFAKKPECPAKSEPEELTGDDHLEEKAMNNDRPAVQKMPQMAGRSGQNESRGGIQGGRQSSGAGRGGNGRG